jgi:hypothetical protein
LKRHALPRALVRADGSLLLRDLPPVMVLALHQLPALLSDQSPRIRRRLTGCPYGDDAEAGAHWEKHAVPELEHLFREARDLVAKDLAGLGPAPGSRVRYLLPIPGKHLGAWLSSLAAVRVSLADVHRLTETEMESPLPPVMVSPKERALLVVHLLGWVQGLLLEASSEELDGETPADSPPPKPRRARKPRKRPPPAARTGGRG